MFGIGETELVLILLFAFLVFGPDKLPGMGRTLGRALRQFQNAQEGFNKVVRADLLDPAADALHEKPKRSEQLKMLHLMLTARILTIRRPLLSVVLASRRSARLLRRLLLRLLSRLSKLSRLRRLSSQKPLPVARLLQLHHKLRLLLLSPMILQR